MTYTDNEILDKINTLSLGELEDLYLNSKIAYYEGNPFMSDNAFDNMLEKHLKNNFSKVVNQIGYKRKDFDFKHPSKMLSLKKIQTESFGDDNHINYMSEEFELWYFSCLDELKIPHFVDIELEYTPKYDGNAINIIYKGNKLYEILTRGNGEHGKNITDRMSIIVPYTLKEFDILSENVILEIRCEVVITKDIFDNKYNNQANPRNFVAGVLGSDIFDPSVINDLTIIPIHFILNNDHIDFEPKFESIFSFTEKRIGTHRDYESNIEFFRSIRQDNKFQLDGTVISLQSGYRNMLGVKDAYPKYAIAIKFPPETAISTVIGVEWNVGKTGDITPVVTVKPVKLMGTVVKRASCYNARYIINNKISNGAIVEICKRGDIIPAISSVLERPDRSFGVPSVCPKCGNSLVFDNVNIKCCNNKCQGRVSKKLAMGAHILGLKNVGIKTLEHFSENFDNFIDLIIWLRNNGNDKEKIEGYGFSYGSKSYEIFMNAFDNIKSISYPQLILLMSIDNVGGKLAEQVSLSYNELIPDWKGYDKNLIELFMQSDMRDSIEQYIYQLEKIGIEIERPKTKVENDDIIYICLTGSPKEFGYRTKEDFLSNMGNLKEVSISDKRCKYLVTDSYESESGKMKTAKNNDIHIFTYEDFINNFKNKKS